MNKLEWLNWATEQGLIECETKGGCTHWYVNSLKSPLVADEVDGEIEFYPTFMLVVLDWIDERGLLLRQLDIKDSSTSKIFRVTIETYKDEIIATQYATSRLEALLGAFKEAVTSAS